MGNDARKFLYRKACQQAMVEAFGRTMGRESDFVRRVSDLMLMAANLSYEEFKAAYEKIVDELQVDLMSCNITGRAQAIGDEWDAEEDRLQRRLTEQIAELEKGGSK